MNKIAFSTLEDHFSLNSDDLQTILDTALAHEGSFAEVFLEYRVYSSINMEEDIIKETSENIMLGAGIRVLHKDQTGYAYTNDLKPEKMIRAASTASSIAKGTPSRVSLPFQTTPPIPNYYPVPQISQEESLENKISMVKAAYQSALKSDRKIKKVKVSFIDQARYLTVANSEGQILSEMELDELPLLIRQKVPINVHQEIDPLHAGNQ